MKAEPMSFQIHPEGNPIPPSFRVFFGGTRHGQLETVFMSKEAMDWKPPKEYVYANTFSQTMSTARGSYNLKWRVYATADRMPFVDVVAVEALVGWEGAEWVTSAEEWMESQGM